MDNQPAEDEVQLTIIAHVNIPKDVIDKLGIDKVEELLIDNIQSEGVEYIIEQAYDEEDEDWNINNG